MTTFAPRKIVHIEISEGIPSLSSDGEYPVLYVVFWWYGIPLGHQEIWENELPMSRDQLAENALKTIAPTIEAHLLEQGIPLPEVFPVTNSGLNALMAWEPFLVKLREQLSAPASETVSVVICTRDRPEHLVRCLRSLQQLSQLPDEILVVDNAPSSDATKQLVAQIPGIRYVLEPRPGLSAARNTGIRHCTGEIIAFTDDDLTLHTDWIARLRQSFSDPKVMVVTGLVLAAELKTQSQFIFEKYWSFNRGYRVLTFDNDYFEKYKLLGVPAWRIGAGANMAFRRKAIELVGDFDERLGAGTSGCSEDSEFWYRVLAEGWTCRYEPTAVAYHCHRREMDSLRRQIFYYMRGHVTELLIRFERYKHWGNLVRIALLLPYFTNLFLFGFLKGRLRYSTLLEEVLGCFSGAKFYFKSKLAANSRSFLNNSKSPESV